MSRTNRPCSAQESEGGRVRCADGDPETPGSCGTREGAAQPVRERRTLIAARRTPAWCASRLYWQLTRLPIFIATAWILLCAMHTAGAAEGSTPERRLESAPVVIDGESLFPVYNIDAPLAQKRADTIAERIKEIAVDRSFDPDNLRIEETELGSSILAGQRLLMTVTGADVHVENLDRKTLAAAYGGRIRSAILDYRAAREPGALAGGAVRSAVATLVALVCLVVLVKCRHRVVLALRQRFSGSGHALEVGKFELVGMDRVWWAVAATVRFLIFVLAVVVIFFWAEYVLSEFPWTRGTASQMLGYVLEPLAAIGSGLVAEIPSLMFLVVLFLVVRYSLKLIHLFFDAVARGEVALPGFYPDWADPTYKLVRVAIVVFALIVAYPYIPGSESDAFKGISIFLGLVFSLSSTTAIGNVIAGYMMTYRRAFVAGDRVKIGDVIGDVVEVRLQVTHLRSLKNEEVIVPNSTILNSDITNFTSYAKQGKLILHTEVGIGYETPWRQVEAMLLTAAERTDGLSREPPPFILQKKLGDFAVTYELNVHCADANRMMALYTGLHRNILDIFNEYNVQIMTPAYEGDPEIPKVVAKENWFTEPARPLGPATGDAPAGGGAPRMAISSQEPLANPAPAAATAAAATGTPAATTSSPQTGGDQGAPPRTAS